MYEIVFFSFFRKKKNGRRSEIANE